MKSFALVYGLVFLLVGVLGFVPGLLTAPHGTHEVAVTGFYGHLLGLFPVNWLHNLVHLAFGAWGIAAARSWVAARVYARSVAVIYLVLALMGLIPGLNTLFGLVPLYGFDVWLHLALAGVAAWFGWGVRTPPAAAAAQRV